MKISKLKGNSITLNVKDYLNQAILKTFMVAGVVGNYGFVGCKNDQLVIYDR